MDRTRSPDFRGSSAPLTNGRALHLAPYKAALYKALRVVYMTLRGFFVDKSFMWAFLDRLDESLGADQETVGRRNLSMASVTFLAT